MLLAHAAKALRGDVVRGAILCPGPGHSSGDRSLSVTLHGGSLMVHSFAGDDWRVCRDYVKAALGGEAPSRPIVERTRQANTSGLEAAQRLWREAGAAEGTPAATYLAGRGLSLPSGISGVALRYHGGCPFRGARTPAMLALVRDVRTNKPLGIHRTAITQGGQAVVVNGEKRAALGPIAGGAVKLTADADVTTCIGVGEGIETTLALRVLPEFGPSPAWALLNAGNLGNLPVLAGVESLWIAEDHDEAGARATECVGRRWTDAGREVFAVKAHAVKSDLNDVVTGRIMLVEATYSVTRLERDTGGHGGTLLDVPPAHRSQWRSFVLFRDIAVTIRKAWLVKDLLGAGELSFIYGAPGSGKSVVVADMAAHVAAGLPWHGQRVEQGAVLYIAAERGRLVERRLTAWRRNYGLDDIPLALMTGALDLWKNQADTLKIVQSLREIERETGFPVRWIIVDTVAAATIGADENSAKDLSAFVSNMAKLQATGAHVTCIHHVPHGDQTRMRGSGVLLGAADATFSVEHDQATGARILKTRKMNDGRDDLQFGFTLESVTLHVDDRTGDETTAPIVLARDMEGQKGTRGNVPLTNAEELAKRVLQDLVSEVGKEPPATFGLPAGVRSVPEDVWRTCCYERRITESELPNTRRKNVARAADGLQRKGIIGVRGGLVWLARKP